MVGGDFGVNYSRNSIVVGRCDDLGELPIILTTYNDVIVNNKRRDAYFRIQYPNIFAPSARDLELYRGTYLD